MLSLDLFYVRRPLYAPRRKRSTRLSERTKIQIFTTVAPSVRKILALLSRAPPFKFKCVYVCAYRISNMAARDRRSTLRARTAIRKNIRSAVRIATPRGNFVFRRRRRVNGWWRYTRTYVEKSHDFDASIVSAAATRSVRLSTDIARSRVDAGIEKSRRRGGNRTRVMTWRTKINAADVNTERLAER